MSLSLPHSCKEIFSNIELAILEENYVLAQELAQEYLQTQPDVASANETLYFLALSYLRQKKLDEARDIFSELVKANIDKKLRDKAYIGLFDSYYMDAQYNEAERVIKKLLRKSSGSEFLSLIYLKAARVNLKLAHWREARGYLKRIIDQFPNSFEVYVARQLMEEKTILCCSSRSFC